MFISMYLLPVATGWIGGWNRVIIKEGDLDKLGILALYRKFFFNDKNIFHTIRNTNKTDETKLFVTRY